MEFGSYTSEAAAAHKQKQIYLCVNCENFNFNTRFCHLKFWTIIIIARMYHNRFFDQYFLLPLHCVYDGIWVITDCSKSPSLHILLT